MFAEMSLVKIKNSEFISNKVDGTSSGGGGGLACLSADFEIENIDVDILDPRYATAIGLIKYVGRNYKLYNKINKSSFIDIVKKFINELLK